MASAISANTFGMMSAPTPLQRRVKLSKVLITLPSNGFGGTERHSLELAGMLARLGCEVTCAAAAALLPIMHGTAAVQRDGVQLVQSALAWLPARASEQNRRRQDDATRRLLDQCRPDAVILPLPWPDFGEGIMAALAECQMPTLVVSHLAPPTKVFVRESDPGIAAAARLRAVWVAVSPAVRDRVVQRFMLPRERIEVVLNGTKIPAVCSHRDGLRAAARQRFGLSAEAELVLFAGRLEVAKGCDLLPAILSRLRAVRPAVLLVAGEGQGADALKRAVTKLGDDQLQLLGFRTDMAELLEIADALLLPSRLEGCPLVFLEAAARRCPVVATDAALEAYGAEAASFAYLAPVGDVAALAAGLVETLEKRAPAAERIASAFRLVRQHDADAMLYAYAGLLRDLAASTAPYPKDEK